MTDHPLLDELLAVYWDPSHNQAVLRSKARMKAVVHHLAERIRTWAPDEGQARICFLAINEVADRLIRDTDVPTD